MKENDGAFIFTCLVFVLMKIIISLHLLLFFLFGVSSKRIFFFQANNTCENHALVRCYSLRTSSISSSLRRRSVKKRASEACNFRITASDSSSKIKSSWDKVRKNDTFLVSSLSKKSVWVKMKKQCLPRPQIITVS